MSDQQHHLQQAVEQACNNRTPLWILGGGSHRELAPPSHATPLKTGGHSGILNYHPQELVITARGGTRISEISKLLQQHHQVLAFDPPRLSEKSTIGGAVASALSGPGRPWSGAVRDHLLGVKVLTGQGRILRLGGEVVKNVAGYDLFRPMAGAHGTLGVLLEISLKTLPQEEEEVSWVAPCYHADALERMNVLQQRRLPISGLCWSQRRLHLRLAGPATEIAQYRPLLQSLGMSLEEESHIWEMLRDRRLSLFEWDGPIWRLSLPPATPLLPFEKDQESHSLIDWGGRQRWIQTDLPSEEIFQLTSAEGGHATRYHFRDRELQPQPLPAPLLSIHQQIKQAVDPANILNPAILYPEL